jgi:hypothetical protein
MRPTILNRAQIIALGFIGQRTEYSGDASERLLVGPSPVGVFEDKRLLQDLKAI